VLEAIDLPSVRSRGYAFQVELTYRALHEGFRVVEVPIVFRDRELGRSKMNWLIAREAVFLLPRLRRRRGRPFVQPVAAEPVEPPIHQA
jgi:dolichol-phosphate mannosyltransferase